MVVDVAAFLGGGEVCIYDSNTDTYKLKKIDFEIHFVSNICNGALAAFDKIVNNNSNEYSNSLWIFLALDTTIVCSIWEIQNGKEMVIVARFEIPRTSWINEPSKDDLNKLKKLLLNQQQKCTVAKLTPKLHVIQYIQKFNDTEFKEIFCDFNNIFFDYDSPKNPMCTLLLNFQNLCKLKNISITETLGRRITFQNQEIHFQIPLHAVIPFSKTFECNIECDNSCLKIYEDILCVQTIEIKQKCKLIVTIFANAFGIFEVKWQSENGNKFLSLNTTSFKKPIEYVNKNFSIPAKLQFYDASLNAMGIDFGTSECCAFVILKNGPDGVVLDDFTAQRTMPSYISVKDINRPCGQVIIKRIENNEQITVFDIKKLIGKKLEEIEIDPLWPFQVTTRCEQIYLYQDSWNYDAIKLCSFLFKQIKQKSEDFQGTKLEETVITVPIYFNENQKEAIEDAAEWALFEKIHFLPEPKAAIFGYSYEQSIPDNSTVLLFDCGGATINICIAKILENEVKILLENHDNNFGSRDFDKILINYFDKILKEKYRINYKESNKKYRLIKNCNEIKHNLSILEEDKLDVDTFIFESDDIISITRKEFEAMSLNSIFRAKNLILDTFFKAKINPLDINIVFQVGGGCRMPMIKNMLKEVLPKAEHRCSIYPEWIIAKGAALYAYSLKQPSS